MARKWDRAEGIPSKSRLSSPPLRKELLMNSAEQEIAVQRGALFLDSLALDGGWEKHIDTKTLEMGSCSTCIVSQLRTAFPNCPLFNETYPVSYDLAFNPYLGFWGGSSQTLKTFWLQQIALRLPKKRVYTVEATSLEEAKTRLSQGHYIWREKE